MRSSTATRRARSGVSVRASYQWGAPASASLDATNTPGPKRKLWAPPSTTQAIEPRTGITTASAGSP